VFSLGRGSALLDFSPSISQVERSGYLKTAESVLPREGFAEKLKLTYFPAAVSAYSAVSFGIVCKS
jgi:hypothetical protein